MVPIQISLHIDGVHRTIIIASVYCPGDEPMISSELQRLVEHSNKIRMPLLLGCDANAHNTIWGSTDTNTRGEYLLEFILSSSLDIYNVGNTPTFVTRVREEVLDLTLGSTSVTRLIRNWRVSSEPSLSDHRIIEFELENISLTRNLVRNLRKTNWENYQFALGNNLERLKMRKAPAYSLELESAVEDLTVAITNALEENCPLGKERSRKDMPWWSKNLSKLRSATRKLFNTAKRNGDWQSYQMALTTYNKEIRKAKRNSFRKFCETISNTPTAARLHKALAKTGGIPTSLKKADGSYTENEDQRALLLLETHFPDSSLSNNGGNVTSSDRPRKEDWETATAICSRRRLEWAISSFQPFKAPGVDGIVPAQLQKGCGVILPHLIKITKSSIALGYIPTQWRRARVVFIPKVGKKDPSHPKSYRPISLTSFLLKTTEKAIDNYLREEVLNTSPLHYRQHAYRAGRSTETALYQLTEVIQSALDAKETVLCAFLDIEGAFDNTSHEAIRRSLERKGVNNTISRWMCELLSTRSAETQTSTGIIKVNTTRGCPQGGVLSPLMWSIVVDELLDKLTSLGINCQAYADDIVLIARGKFEGTLCDIIQGGLRATQEWCHTAGLNINPEKTTIVPFTRRRKLQGLKGIRLSGTILTPVNEVKYLGVYLDSKLMWRKHTVEISKKATRALMICKSLAGKSWGCNPSILRWMYIAIVRPMITYGAVAWAKRTSLVTTRDILSKVQRLACLCITGAMRTCPTAAMEVLLELTPLHLMVEDTADKTILRMAKEGIGREKCISSKEYNVLLRKLPLLAIPRDDTIRKFNFEKNFLTKLSNKKNWSNESTIYGLSNHTVKWYTDGSRTDEGTGAGVFGPGTKRYESMGKCTSIFQAEICAIDRCVRIILEKRYRNCNIAVMSDSQAAIKALDAYIIKSKLVWECLHRLNELGRNNRVTICWIPGHAGIMGNEAADSLARQGAAEPFIGPEPFCGIGEHTLRDEFRRVEKEKRAIIFNNTQGLRQAKKLLGNYNLKRFKACIGLSKNNLRILTGLLTGHCRLREHLRKIGYSEEGLCRFCDESAETPDHILESCGALTHKRIKYLGKYQLLDKDIQTMDPLLILRFVKETGLDEVL